MVRNHAWTTSYTTNDRLDHSAHLLYSVHFTRTEYSYIKMVQCPGTQIFFLINFFVDPRGRSPELYLEVYIFHNDPAMNQDP